MPPVATATSYKVDYPIYGKLPEANKMPRKPFATVPGKLEYYISETQRAFNDSGYEKHFAEAAEEKRKVEDIQKKQWRGKLAP